MPHERRSRRTATTPLALVTSVVLVAGLVSAYLLQPATPVTADDALREFREGTSGGPTPTASSSGPASPRPAMSAAAPGPAGGPASLRPGLTPSPRPSETGTPAPGPQATGPASPHPPPEAGVYSFVTEGWEETDALSGSRHEYPAETYVSTRRNGCGAFTWRWQPLQERWEESDFCMVGDDLELRRVTMYHEFFGKGDTMAYTCPAGAVVFRFGARTGDTWRWGCHGDRGSIENRVTVVGVEPVSIEGQRRPALRIAYDITATGDTQGRLRQERWIDRQSGLVLRLTSETDVRTRTPFGFANYDESYVLDLVSQAPRR